MKMNKKNNKNNNADNILSPQNIDYAAVPEEFDTTDVYLGFASNGMTNNEKIDEYNYYNNYLDSGQYDAGP